ncbi:MAG TPA: lytic murein transglycosylase [Myxococcaceae bacterium]|nr:lytic murein transglycosylase [Myxococcaceae bacterium]
MTLAASALAAAPAYDPAKPATWHLSAKLPRQSEARKALLAEWASRPAEPGEKVLTVEEGEALLDDPRAELIYGEKTVSIIAPSMLVRQRQEHLDLLKLFLEPDALATGVAFFRDHENVLERAAQKHRVDPTVVVSILMWESKLGVETGSYVAFNSFASQAFFADEADAVALKQKGESKRIDPEKQAERVQTIRVRARKNLKALVRVCKARGMDPLAVKGSWAGALGYPQFMPASLRWAEDGDGDGKIDLYTFDDSIASIARYLGDHGFEKSPEHAVWSYNHESAYVSGVMAWAKALQERLEAPDAGVALDAGR